MELQERSLTWISCCWYNKTLEDVTIPEKAFITAWIFFLLHAADRLGKFIVAGGAAVGLGALAYYGMGMSSEIGAIEKAA